MGLISGSRCPLEEEMATHSSILARESNGHMSLVGYCPQSCSEVDTTEHTPTTTFSCRAQI